MKTKVQNVTLLKCYMTVAGNKKMYKTFSLAPDLYFSSRPTIFSIILAEETKSETRYENASMDGQPVVSATAQN